MSSPSIYNAIGQAVLRPYAAPTTREKSQLTVEQQEVLKLELKTRIYNTAGQVIAWVEEQLKVSYSL